MKKHAADTIGAVILSAALIASLSPVMAFGTPGDDSRPQITEHTAYLAESNSGRIANSEEA